VEALAEIAGRHGLSLIYDAAHALGCSHKGRMLGGFGLAELFSLHATKFFHTLEGGLLATNDDALAERVQRMRNFGFAGPDYVAEVGTNAKLNEFSAAMGLTLLEGWDTRVEHNRRQYDTYRQTLAGLPGARLVECDPSEKHNYQFAVLEIDPALAGLTRDELYIVLAMEKVGARRYFYPGCHRTAPYATLASGGPATLPVTERLVEQLLSLPTGAAVSSDEAERIAAVVRLALSDPAAVRAGLAGLASPLAAANAPAQVLQPAWLGH
jgi:dTDP-4-amino-4,6-dideoxygalactose transaminase